MPVAVRPSVASWPGPGDAEAGSEKRIHRCCRLCNKAALSKFSDPGAQMSQIFDCSEIKSAVLLLHTDPILSSKCVTRPAFSFVLCSKMNESGAQMSQLFEIS